MLQSKGLQKVRHDLSTEQQQQQLNDKINIVKNNYFSKEKIVESGLALHLRKY